MKRALALAAVVLALGGCATTQAPEPRLAVQKVEVPIAVACAADPGPEPAYADSPEALRQAGDIFERVKLLLAGRAQRDARLAELKGAVAGCR